MVKNKKIHPIDVRLFRLCLDEREVLAEHWQCMPQCSYACIATAGKMETWHQRHSTVVFVVTFAPVG
jgi:hypothetical protein